MFVCRFRVACVGWCGAGKLLTVVTSAVQLCPSHSGPLALYTHLLDPFRIA